MDTSTFRFEFVKIIQVKVDHDIFDENWHDAPHNCCALKEIARNIAWDKCVMVFPK